jgi:alkaline phosphatase D
VNPHIKEIELDNHGYMVLDIQNDKAQADWYFVDSTNTKNKGESFYKGYVTQAGKNCLKPAVAYIPTRLGGPLNPGELPLNIEDRMSNSLLCIGNYPNPFSQSTLIHYAISKPSVISITIFDIRGIEVMKGFTNIEHQPGPYVFELNAPQLPTGTYTYKISSDQQTITKTMHIVK